MSDSNNNLYLINYIKNLNQIPQNVQHILKKLIISFEEQQNYFLNFINKFPNFSKTEKMNSINEISYLLQILNLPFGSLFLNDEFYLILSNEIENYEKNDNSNEEYENEEEEDEVDNNNDDNNVLDIRDFLSILVDIFNFPIFYDKSEIFKNLYLNYMNDDNELENNIRYELNIIEKLYSDFNLIENNIYNSKNLSNDDKNNINNALIDYSNDVQKLNHNKNLFPATIEFFNNNLEYLINISKKYKIFNNNFNIEEDYYNINDINDDEFYQTHLNLNKSIKKTNQNKIKENNNNNKIINYNKNEDIKYRKYFIYEEHIYQYEDLYTEFKNYYLPFRKEQTDELKRQICGFLNAEGGRIYIGINDNRIVKGISLKEKEIDILGNELVNYTYNFYPPLRLENKIRVDFIPIKDKKNKNIKGLFVIKIIIKQGDPKKLYSLTKDNCFKSSMRLKGQVANLSTEEIYNEIIKRYNGEVKVVDENEFNDVEPEPISSNFNNENKNIYTNNNNFIYDKKIIKNKFIKNNENINKQLFPVRITNLPFNINDNDIKNMLIDFPFISLKTYKSKRNKTKFCYINFDNLELANELIIKINNVNINGFKLKANLKLSKNNKKRKNK